MKPAPKYAALAPVLLALAACGGATEDAGEPAAEPTGATAAAAPADAATPAPGATPTPDATPSESPSPTPTPTPSAAATRAAATPPPVFNQCTACHDSGIGPSLAGVIGRRSGTLAGFEYSQAMKDAGLTWNQATLDRYLENPRGVVPGTTMAYNGVKDAAQRQAVINYLKTL